MGLRQEVGALVNAALFLIGILTGIGLTVIAGLLFFAWAMREID